MSSPGSTPCRVAIACGGTGGHLFPGLAVAEELRRRGAAISLLISPKEIDQTAVQTARGCSVVTLPAVAMQSGSRFAFVQGFWRSWCAARTLFRQQPPAAVLAMGGFTAAPPVLAARSLGGKTFLHESNTIPGRANRFLARWVDQAFVGFPETEGRLPAREVAVTGTPVRADFHAREAAQCRQELGLDPGRPVLLVMGGSQGASGINHAILRTLPVLARQALQWQWLHLTGPNDGDKVRAAYAAQGLKAIVKPFLPRLDLALGAATACVSRAGASSLAELAALQLPAILIPYPAAADNHQWHNARAFEETGAAWLLPEAEATPDRLAEAVRDLMDQPTERALMKTALAQWHAPQAARLIADRMWQALGWGSESPATDLISPLPENTSGNRARLGGVTVA